MPASPLSSKPLDASAQTTSPQAHPISSANGLVFVTLAISLLYAVYLGSFGVVLPAFAHAFDLGTEVQGRLFPASFGGSVSGVLLCGSLSDKWGRKPILLVCLAVTAAGLLLLGTARAFGLILLVAGLIGGGGAAGQTVSAALLSDLFPVRRAALMNAIQVAFGIGAISGPLSMQIVQSTPQASGWRGFYLVLAALQAFLLAVLLFLPVRERPHPRDDSAPPVALWRERPLLTLCVSAALYSGAEVAFFSWMPTRLRADFGALTNVLAGSVPSVFWVGMTAGRTALAALLSPRNGTRPPLRRLRFALALCGALVALPTVFAPLPLLTLVGVGVSGLCFSGLFSLLLAEAGERYPQVAGAALGFVSATSGAGAALLPWLCGALSGAGFAWSVALLPVPLALAGVVALASTRATDTDR